MVDIRNLDLNLLVVFDALMRERNATRAAVRVRLSQPAVSYALRRLRDVLDDPLFVRTRGGMQPTPRAEEIFSISAPVLEALQAALRTGSAFDPSQARRSFEIMLSDSGELIYLPRLIQYMQRRAPGVRLTIRRLARALVHEELASGTLHLAIGWIDRSGGLRSEVLFNEDLVAIASTRHPRIKTSITLSQFLDEWHIVVGKDKSGAQWFFQPADARAKRSLAATTASLKIAMRVPHFLAVPHIVSNTELICLVPRKFGVIYADQGLVRVVSLPINLKPLPISMFWHPRVENDPAILWLRSVIKDLFTDRTEAASRPTVKSFARSPARRSL